ncbi:MAG: pyridoxal phosphate-dependent aminotransferase [Candidatus Avoscillospira sp.]
MKISERAQLCELSPMRKFHPFAVEAEAKGRKIYHLNIGQPDIETPPAFFESLRQFADPVLAYAESPGRPSLLKAIQRYYAGIGVELAEKDILITTGGSEALSMLMLCILDPGSEVLVPEPFYPNYNTFIRAAGGVIHPIPTSPEEGYHFADRAKIEAEINENTRAILFTNPSNPTGVILTAEERRMLLDVAKEHDLYLISDEVYREFNYDADELSTMASFADGAENVIIIDSVSKRFSACGARIGCLISRNQQLMAEAMKFCQARLSVATLDQVASAALYAEDKSYFDAVRAEYKLRRDTVLEKLAQIPNVICKKPQGAFYLMAALPVDDAENFQKWLLTDFEDHGETVMFAPGQSFYATPGKGINEVRIAYVLKQADLERAMNLLALGIEAYNKRG